tara:strand:- start:2839 stop:3162 length:324 start_codon:yes stop_codon:yes gene_type:complete
MLALSEAGCVVFRNETAGAWLGKVIHKAQGQVTLNDARMMTFGLCVGSSDIIGITPEGRFLAVEVKTAKGKPTKEQLNFIEQVRKAGGIAGIARSPQDALDLLTHQP